MKFLKKKKGVTLIELMAVIAIIGILMSIMIPNVSRYVTDSRIDATTSELRIKQTEVQKYYLDNPEGLMKKDELEEVIGTTVDVKTQETDKYVFYETSGKKDPWGQPYRIIVNNEDAKYFIMYSNGPNKMKDINLDLSQVGDDIVFIYYPEN